MGTGGLDEAGRKFVVPRASRPIPLPGDLLFGSLVSSRKFSQSVRRIEVDKEQEVLPTHSLQGYFEFTPNSQCASGPPELPRRDSCRVPAPRHRGRAAGDRRSRRPGAREDPDGGPQSDLDEIPGLTSIDPVPRRVGTFSGPSNGRKLNDGWRGEHGWKSAPGNSRQNPVSGHGRGSMLIRVFQRAAMALNDRTPGRATPCYRRGRMRPTARRRTIRDSNRTRRQNWDHGE